MFWYRRSRLGSSRSRTRKSGSVIHWFARRSAPSDVGGAPRRKHSALAEVLARDPDRAVWHRAASIEGYDADVAAALEEAARRALRRGADAVAAAGFERAAALTQDTDARAALLIVAADIELHLGLPDLGRRLLRFARAPAGLTEDRQLQLAFATEILDETAWSGATKVPALVRVAEQQRDAGKTELAAYTLQNAALRYWYGNPDQTERDQLVAAVESLGMAPDKPVLLSVLAFADPVGQGALVLERLSKIAVPADPDAAFLVGAAAQAVWAHDLSIPFLTPAAASLRAMGALGALAQTLVTQTWGFVHLANPPLALSAAGEAETLARETGQPRWAAAATLATASIAAMRGDSSAAEILATEVERIFLTAGASPRLALVQFARARAALADGSNADAYDHASRIFDEADFAYHPFLRSWAVADLAEAAAAVGAHEEARALIAPVEAIEAKMHGPLLRAELGVARALLADDSQAPGSFAEALSAIEAPWPYHRGRLMLAHGSWLRRQRRVADSRRPPPRRSGSLRHARLRARGRARSPRAPSLRRDQQAPRPRGVGSAFTAGAPDCTARRRRPDESRDRPAALPLSPHRGVAPLPRLPEARRHVALAARRDVPSRPGQLADRRLIVH